MKFDASKALKKATGRAKSDVANKLVSMLLHEISRRVCSAGELAVADIRYIKSVMEAFGHDCIYCGRNLEHDRAAVEHLDGMNRFRIGLHVPGNVAMSCRSCNAEKRRDDQRAILVLAPSGWESFLSHNQDACTEDCKSCRYWQSVWPDKDAKRDKLVQAMARIHHFRGPYSRFLIWSEKARPAIQDRVEDLYRSCQAFASAQINELTSELEFDFASLKVSK